MGELRIMVPTPSDPFFTIEFYAFRAALLILFLVGLYRLIRNDIGRRGG
jgi:hypothetical protein